MQLTLTFLDLPAPQAPDPLPPAASSPATVPWNQLDEAARLAALEILARLIARMLAAEPTTTEASHE